MSLFIRKKVLLNKKEIEEEKELLHSYYRIRKAIGTLGVLLPILVFGFQESFLPSISHSYYTKSAIFFISILFGFGLFLMSYKGYEKDKEKLSDNVLTHIAGLAALLVVLIPTTCANGLDFCNINSSGDYLFGHEDETRYIIHLISAGIFLFLMGWMSIFRFTKGGDGTLQKRRKKIVYKISGYLVWGCIALMLIEFGFDWHITKYDIFILESVAVFSFGFSWLVKGKAIKDIVDFKKWLLKRDKEEPINKTKGTIGHIILNVKDFNQSELFYDKLLTGIGFNIDHVDEGDYGKMKSYKQGEHNLWVRFDKQNKSEPFVRNVGLDHLAFEVKSKNEVDNIFNLVKELDVRITREPKMYPEYTSKYYAFYFRDPNGIPLEIFIE